MAAAGLPPSRRTVLRLGGGVIALAVGVTAGVVDRRRHPPTEALETVSRPEPASSATTTITTASPSTTTSTSLPPAIVAGVVPPGVHAVGAAYLRARPEEADIASLLASLPAADGDVLAAARRQVVDDFASQATVSIDGWVLARSEARAAAVLTLVCTDQC